MGDSGESLLALSVIVIVGIVLVSSGTNGIGAGKINGANVRADWIMPSGVNYNVMWWDIARDIGINTFRLTLDVGGPYTVQQFRDYLNLAGSYDIKTIVLIPTTGYPANVELSKETVLPILQAFKGDSRILMWDLKNEPDVANPSEIAWLTNMSQWFHANDNTHKITIGGWHNSANGHWNYPEDGMVLQPLVDVYSPHLYCALSQLPASATVLAQHKANANGKPIVLQEYGYTIDGSNLTMQNQLTYYKSVLNNTQRLGYAGSCFWNLVPPYPQDATIAHMSIVLQDGTYTPAADYLKQHWRTG